MIEYLPHTLIIVLLIAVLLLKLRHVARVIQRIGVVFVLIGSAITYLGDELQKLQELWQERSDFE